MTYGIAKLAIIPCRAEGNDRAEIVTQLLFGETYTVIEEQEKWVYIETALDKYKCWICIKQFSEITQEDFHNHEINQFPMVLDMANSLLDESTNESLPITLGATLSFFHNKRAKIRSNSFKYEGKINEVSTENLVEYSKLYLNAPYLWGGRTPFGIDCSGFTQIVYKLCGIILPRDAYQQAELGEEVHLHDINAGDLAYFHNDSGRITHVGLMIDEKHIIHASGKVRIDTLDEKGIYNDEIKDYSHQLTFVKRIID